MTKLSAAQTKGKIKHIASKNKSDSRVLLRIYMMNLKLKSADLIPLKMGRSSKCENSLKKWGSNGKKPV